MVRRFWGDREGSLQETTALIAAAVTILGVGAAMGLNRLTSDGALPHIAIIMPDSQFAQKVQPLHETQTASASQPALDDTPVGSIPDRLSRPIVLNPCDGSQKQD